VVRNPSWHFFGFVVKILSESRVPVGAGVQFMFYCIRVIIVDTDLSYREKIGPDPGMYGMIQNVRYMCINNCVYNTCV